MSCCIGWDLLFFEWGLYVNSHTYKYISLHILDFISILTILWVYTIANPLVFFLHNWIIVVETSILHHKLKSYMNNRMCMKIVYALFPWIFKKFSL